MSLSIQVWELERRSAEIPTEDDRGNDWTRWRRMIDRRLGELAPPESAHPELLHRAMRYSLLSGGKRLRPIMTLQVATALGAPETVALDPACAVEMVHAASLVLDDLPCMDDAALRRRRPANHLVFGEDTAILAATALLNLAYGVLAESDGLEPSVRLDLTRALTRAVGSDGIIGGQLFDLRPGCRVGGGSEDLAETYRKKTGALFVAALELGARVAGLDGDRIRPVRDYGASLGLAYQLLDDLLDAFATAEDVGKDVRQDRCGRTLAARLGFEGAVDRILVHVDDAVDALEPLGRPGLPLAEFARSYARTTMERVLSV